MVILRSMKTSVLYFIWMYQILSILICIACVRGKEGKLFDLAAFKAKDLIKLDEHIQSDPSVSLEGVANIPFSVKSPDGKRVAKVEMIRRGIESQVYVVSVSAIDGEPETKIAEAVNLFGLCWSPDGSKIAFSEGSIVHIADRDGQTKQIIYSGPGGPYPGASFNLKWVENGQKLSFIQVENAQDSELANPAIVTIKLGMR